MFDLIDKNKNIISRFGVHMILSGNKSNKLPAGRIKIL